MITNNIKIAILGFGNVGRAFAKLLTEKQEEIDKNSLFASITGTTSVVSITTDLMGTVSIVEHEPEIEQTAYGVFSDLIRVLSNNSLTN